MRLLCRVYEGLMSPARDLLNLYRQYLQMRVQHRRLHREGMGVLGRRRLRDQKPDLSVAEYLLFSYMEAT